MTKLNLTIPLSDYDPDQNKPQHINAQIKDAEAITLQRIRLGLVDANAKMPDGRPVYSWAETVRWLLIELGNAMPKKRNTSKTSNTDATN